jgi:hypothetical protein
MITYLVPYPTAIDGLFSFDFSAKIPEGRFRFAFKWINEVWNLWVTLPDGSVRRAGVYPGDTSWTGFIDYGIKITTPLKTIGFSNLTNTNLLLTVK